MEVRWIHKDVDREGLVWDFFYSVTRSVIVGDNVWMWMATGALGVDGLSGHAGSGSFAA